MLEQTTLDLIDRYIDANIEQPIALADLAAIAVLSEYYFAREFRQTVGMPPHQYLIQKRIERAKLLLTTTQLSLLEICHAVGYASQSHFSHIFKQNMGLSPRDYRSQ